MPKAFRIDAANAERNFKENAFAFFPSSRSEVPYWLNAAAQSSPAFSLYERYNNKVSEPIYVESAVQEFAQWMLGLLVDSRADVSFSVAQQGGLAALANVNAPVVIEGKGRWQFANQLLQNLLDDPQARFVWLGRKNSQKIGIQSGDKIKAIGLNSLSNGQLSLLGIFGTLLRYCDSKASSDPSQVGGICIIDEIDAHMHVDLQTVAVPNLIKLFPKIQFIISAHSPLFLMGMEKAIPGLNFLHMPEGELVPAEGYREFAKAFEVFQQTSAFTRKVAELSSEAIAPTVLLAGETDPLYFIAACKYLGYDGFDASTTFKWIGAMDAKGQGFFTGDDSLKRAMQMLSANEELVKAPTLVLFDCDCPQGDLDSANLHVRTMHKSDNNTEIEVGIENLLPLGIASEDFYEVKKKKRKDGGWSEVRSLDKMKLCQFLVANGSADVFDEFRVEIEQVCDLLGLVRNAPLNP